MSLPNVTVKQSLVFVLGKMVCKFLGEIAIFYNAQHFNVKLGACVETIDTQKYKIIFGKINIIVNARIQVTVYLET